MAYLMLAGAIAAEVAAGLVVVGVVLLNLGGASHG